VYLTVVSTNSEYHQSSQAEGELLSKASEVLTSFKCHCLKRQLIHQLVSVCIALATEVHFT